MKEGLSITWSNSHQRLFNDIMNEAVETRRLIIMNTGQFIFSEDFFDQRATKDFLDRIPRDMLDVMVKDWIKKRGDHDPR